MNQPSAPRRTSRRTYKARRGGLRAFSVTFAVTLAAIIGYAWYSSTRPTFVQLPNPSLSGAPQGGQSNQGTAGRAITTIPASPATALYIPNSDPSRSISTTVSAMSPCRSVINPPRARDKFGGVYSCPDFAQPSTSSASLSVLAGHSSRFDATAFNRLYIQGQKLVGQRVYVKTRASESHWLVYRVQAVYSPHKSDLPYMTQIWGGDGRSTAGRLLLVTCRQRDDSPEATDNYVAVAQFEGVQ